MPRYLSILKSFLRNNLIREMEYRGNFAMLLALDVFWVFFQVAVVQIYFQYTDSILGWSRGEIFLLVGFFRMVKGIVDVLVRRNLFNIPDYMVAKGNLDLVLTKPVNSAFMISLRYQEFADLGAFIGGLLVVIYTFITGVVPTSVWVILQIFFFAVFASVAFYSLLFMFTTLSFFIPRLTALRPYYDLVSNLLRYPSEVFTGGKFMNEAFLLPLIVITTLPIRVILGRSSVSLIAIEVVVVVVLFILAYKFWNFALRHYSSASS